MQFFNNKPNLDEKLFFKLFPSNNNIKIDDIKIIDERDDLKLLHYFYDYPENDVYNYRGVILDEKDNIICKSFPYTPTYTWCEKFFDDCDINFDDYTIIEGKEGTVLRLFWFCDRWYLSTHKKINGENSRWSSKKTFGEMFKETLGIDGLGDIDLDKNKVYIFLLCHPENRIVIKYDAPKLYYTMSYDKEKHCFEEPNICDVENINDKQNILLPTKLDIKTKQDFENKIIEYEDNNQVKGIMCYKKLNNEIECFMINTINYEKKSEIRGNEPNLRMRWLQLKELHRQKELEDLIDDMDFFDSLKKDYAKIVNYLTSIIYDIDLIQEERFVINRIKNELKRDRTIKNNIERFKNLIQRIFNNYNPRIQNAIIRNMKKKEKFFNH